MAKWTATPRSDLMMIVALSMIWAATYYVLKSALQFADPISLSFLRAILGGAFIFPLCVRALKELRKNDYLWICAIGLLNITFFFFFINVGLITVRPDITTALVYTQPIFVVVFSPLVGERLDKRKIIGVLGGFSGVALIFLSSLLGSSLVTGDLLILCGSLSWSAATLLFKRWNRQLDTFVISSMQLLAGGIFVLPILVTEKSFLVLSLGFWADLAFLVLASGIGQILYFRVLSRMPASQFSSYLFLVPALSVILGIILNFGLPSWNELAGILLVGFGIMVTNSQPGKPLLRRD